MKPPARHLALLLLLASQPAHTFTTEEGKIRCGPDMERLCGGAPDPQCLMARENSLASPCRTFLREQPQGKTPVPPVPQEIAPRKTMPPSQEAENTPLPEKPRDPGPCAQDVQRLCAGSAREHIGQCLRSRFSSLSPECRQKIRQRLAEEPRTREWPPRKEWHP